jgi:5'-3' exoribonuclease 1
MNESGTINTRRLQLVLDEMRLWEQDIFEKEYADLNWYKGKQIKHTRAMEVAEKKAKLGKALSFWLSTLSDHIFSL